MGIESVFVSLTRQVSEALAPTDHSRRDSRRKQQGPHRESQAQVHDDPHPVQNDLGQTTGKLIDIVA